MSIGDEAHRATSPVRRSRGLTPWTAARAPGPRWEGEGGKGGVAVEAGGDGPRRGERGRRRICGLAQGELTTMDTMIPGVPRAHRDAGIRTRRLMQRGTAGCIVPTGRDRDTPALSSLSVDRAVYKEYTMNQRRVTLSSSPSCSVPGRSWLRPGCDARHAEHYVA